MQMASTSKKPPNTTKRASKRKLDDTVLLKARTALGLPLLDSDPSQEEPSLKLRKPRHNTEAGQKYLNRKLQQLTPAVNSKGSSRNSKKGKKRKKKSTTDLELTLSVKNPVGEKKHATEALSYLQLWSINRDHWKFQKRIQSWLLRNCLNVNLVDDKRFEILVEYIGSVKGAAKQTTLTEMQTLVSKYEMCNGAAETDITPKMFERARQIVQMLNDD